MELERAGVPVVTAEHGSAARLCDERELDLAPAGDDAILAAPLAAVAVAAPTVTNVVGQPVDRHSRIDRAASRRRGCAAAPCLEPVLLQPVLHRRVAPSERLGDRR